jgi:hypothetical protein
LFKNDWVNCGYTDVPAIAFVPLPDLSTQVAKLPGAGCTPVPAGSFPSSQREQLRIERGENAVKYGINLNIGLLFPVYPTPEFTTNIPLLYKDDFYRV